MLGDTVRQARIKKNLTQAKLARLAGVSRRHLAALEKGANVSVLVLRKVASVLELAEIQLGDLSLRSGNDGHNGVNVPLLTDTIREARAEANRAQTMLARAEDLLNGTPGLLAAQIGAPVNVFPQTPVTRLDSAALRESADPVEVRTAGTIRQGQPIDEEKKETVIVPKSLLDSGEILLRCDNDSLRSLGIEHGDLLVVELRPRGRAASGELVIAKAGANVYVGRWWQKHGQKALMADGLQEIGTGKARRNLKVMAAINQVVRG
jgi:transcriptional regulator with XRE-family HTH domain